MKIEQLEPGMRVWNVMRRQMGNTTLRDTAVFSILVKEVDPDKRWALASWNGNTAERFYSRDISKWRKNKPVTIENGFGASRLANREELKLIREQGKIDACQPGERCEKHRRDYSRLKASGGLTVKYCNECRREQGLKPL